jgi:hypothetical protein
MPTQDGSITFNFPLINIKTATEIKNILKRWWITNCKNLFPTHAMKAFKRCGAIVPLVHLDTTWTRVVSLTAKLPYPWEKRPHFSLNMRLDRPQSQSGSQKVDKNLLLWKGSNIGWFGPQPTHRTAYSIPALGWRMVYNSTMRWNGYVLQSILYTLHEPEVLYSYIRTVKQMHGIYLYTLDFVYRSAITAPPVQRNFRYPKYTVNLLSK